MNLFTNDTICGIICINRKSHKLVTIILLWGIQVKYTFEQISNGINLFTYGGIMLLITMIFIFLYRIALLKFKRISVLAIILSVFSLILWLVMLLSNMQKNMLYVMITLELTCLAVTTIILAIITLISKKRNIDK